jgi:thiol-disulfide isomerase/thioredoxin
MLIRLAILAGVAFAVWALSWGLRRYAANATTPEQFDAADGAGGPAEPSPLLVTFSGPYCLECEEVLPRLRAASAAHAVPLQVIDIKESPHLAAKYDVRLTPTTFVVGSGGKVQAGWLGTPPDGEIEAALAAVAV